MIKIINQIGFTTQFVYYLHEFKFGEFFVTIPLKEEKFELEDQVISILKKT